jgi:hypothetical protein
MRLKKFTLIQVIFAISLFSCDSFILTPVVNVCDGVGIESAKNYNPQEKTHKIILYEKGKNLRHEWNSEIPKEYQGSYTDFDLVGCIEFAKESIQTCSYTNGGKRTRVAQKVTVTIIVARTGLPIASNYFIGTVSNCPLEINDSSDANIDGDPVKYEQISAWLLGYLKN